MVGGEARRPPRTDNRRHPIRVSLGGSRFRVARFRFAGHSLGYSMSRPRSNTELSALGKEPTSPPRRRLWIGRLWLAKGLAQRLGGDSFG